jgi:hypothetical protein
VIIGLDVTTWCKARGSERFRSDTVFPEWLYDKERFNDFEGLVNLKMLRFEIKQILIALGAKPAVPRNGYLNHLDDAKWTLSMARKKIYGDFTPTIRGKEHDEQTVVSANYPSLSLLDRALQALPASTEVIIALMPFHASVQDVTPAELENWKRCKQRIASFANGESRHVVDFFIISPWTTSDENFWDRSHFRTSIARAFMARLKEAIELGRDADDGTYVLATPSRLSTMDYQ